MRGGQGAREGGEGSGGLTTSTSEAGIDRPVVKEPTQQAHTHTWHMRGLPRAVLVSLLCL